MENIVQRAEWGGWPRLSSWNGICLKRDGTLIFTVDSVYDNRVYTFHPDKDAGRLVVLAGHEQSGYVNETGIAARFRSPTGIAVCKDGSLVVADTGNHRIRKISPLGVVTTVAGNGQQGLTDDGPAAEAMFNRPSGVAVRADGGIVVADCNNHRIRLISLEGLVTTLAGCWPNGFADGSAAEAKFDQPYSVAVCPNGDVLVCDTNNNRIRRIAAGTSVVSTVAGSGEEGHFDEFGGAATFEHPNSIAVDMTGHAVVMEYGGYIRKIVLETGEVTTVVSGLGNNYFALAIDAAGSIVFANPVTQQIRDIGLGPGFSVEGFPLIWTPTRLNHRTIPEWSRDAVDIVMLASTRARQIKIMGSDNSGWLGHVPVLPREVWEIIIGLIPRYQLGRPAWATPVRDPNLEEWIERQMIMYAQNKWGKEDANQKLMLL